MDITPKKGGHNCQSNMSSMKGRELPLRNSNKMKRFEEKMDDNAARKRKGVEEEVDNDAARH